MSDEEIRELQRLAALGDPDAMEALRRLLRRTDPLGIEIQRIEAGLPPVGYDPEEERWTQIGGDMSATSHGAVLARVEPGSSYAEILRIENVVDLIGDNGYQDPGYPFWIDDWSVDLSALTLADEQTRQAIEHFSNSCQEDFSETFMEGGLLTRAALLYEASREVGDTAVCQGSSRSGWSPQVLPAPADEIRWWGFDPDTADDQRRQWTLEEWRDEDETFARELRERGLEINAEYPWPLPEPEDEECDFCENVAIGWDEDGSLACAEHGGWA